MKTKRFVPKFDAILFDIDNVLVDTRESYLAAIQKTVEIYLNHPGIVSLKEIDQFKLLGGFNDDWDCCYGIITFLQTSIQGKPIRFGDHRRQRLMIAELAELFPERPLGMDGLLKHLRISYQIVEEPSFKKIARIFQEVYLGKELFSKVGAPLVGARKGRAHSVAVPQSRQGPPLQYWNKPGLIQKEKPIFPKSVLEKIHNHGVRLGIVTGRNRFEAQYALQRFGIWNLFDGVVTIDDVRKEEKKTGKLLRKPHPWPVLEAANRVQKSVGSTPRGCPEGRHRGLPLRFLYIGDLPDDVWAAKRAKKQIQIQSMAFPQFARDPQSTLLELKKLKPDFFLKHPKDLLKIVLG